MGAKKPKKLARGSVGAPSLLEFDKLADRAEKDHDSGRRWSATDLPTWQASQALPGTSPAV